MNKYPAHSSGFSHCLLYTSKITILYPADYFDIRKVDADYRQEYEEAVKFPEFQAVLYNYDNFVAGEPFRLYPACLLYTS